MKITNKILSTFGPAGSFSGYLLLFAGLVTLNSWTGILLVLIGTFFAFSYSGTTIDIDNSQVRQFSQLFGLFKVGDWEDLKQYKEVTILKDDTVFRVFSRGNRTLDSKSDKFIVYIVGEDLRFKVPVIKTKTFELANIEAEKISKELGLPIVENSDY